MEKNTEEYQFKEENEYLNEDNVEPTIKAPEFNEIREPSKSFSPLKRLPIKNKKVVIIVGVIVAVFLVMQVIKFFSSSSKKENLAQQPLPVGTISTQTNQASSNIQSSTVALVNEKLKGNENKLTQMQSDVNDIKTKFTDVNKEILSLNATVQQLSAEIQELVAERNALKETMRGKKTPYHIRAIVEGRAWLETGNGSTTTVRIGSSLGRYGNVTKIDDRNGIVVTSKGAIISYGVNDL